MGGLFNQIRQCIINRIFQVKKLVLIGNFYMIIGLVAFMVADKQRRESEVYQAWQVITTAHGQKSSGGRIEALEFLNTKPLIFPWIGLTWDKDEQQWLLGWRGKRQNLRGLEVPNADLKGIDLAYAHLSQGNLVGANLSQANLNGANLSEANLKDANLSEANLAVADMEGTNLAKADLKGANLASAFLWGANLAKADLKGANLASAFLWRVNLESAFLWGANLTGADLEGAKLSGAILVGTNLSQISNLNKNILIGAFYTQSSNLELCRVFNPDLNIDNDNCDTKFPVSFNPQESGMILIETPEQARQIIRNY